MYVSYDKIGKISNISITVGILNVLEFIHDIFILAHSYESLKTAGATFADRKI